MNITFDLLMKAYEDCKKFQEPNQAWPWSGLAVANPDVYAGIRTAAGIERQREQSLAGIQRIENGIRNSILDSMRIVVDQYAPKTVRRQFRVPRSKKKRIRKKWAKNPKNWREETVLWIFNQGKLGVAMRNFTLP